MKLILLFFAYFAISSMSAQIQTAPLEGVKIADSQLYSATDTIPKVFYLKNKKKLSPVAWLLNGDVIHEQQVSTINPDMIAAMNIETGIHTIGEKEYDGLIKITTKEAYQPRFLTLNELKSQYTEFSDLPTVFLINGKMVNADYDEFLVDETFILKIEVETMENVKEELNLHFIKIITRTKQNLKKANTIVIRGEEAHS